MKIVFIVPWITQSRGGTENVGHLMANAMAYRGHEVHVFTFDDQKRPLCWPLNDTIKLHYLAEDDGKMADSQMAVCLAEPCPDLIVGLHTNRGMLRYVTAAHKIGVPLVLSEHVDPHFPRRIGAFTEEERQQAFEGATRVHLLNNAFVETVSDSLVEKISVIPNTVEKVVASADPIGGRKKTVLSVARLMPNKNVNNLLNEFSLVSQQNKDWVLAILGDGPRREELEDQVKKLGIQDQVDFLGYSKSPYKYIAKAQLFVHPSLFEGFPMSSLEAMAHGLPLIGYAACNGINEQIVDGLNGRLAARSTEKGCLAACLDDLMNDPKARKRMGAASKNRFDTLYSNEVVFDAWEKLFKKAYGEGSVNA